MSPANPDVPNLRILLMREHRFLEQTFDALLAAFDADAELECARLWTEFDTRLQAHMRLEEDVMLPAFAREHAKQAAELLAEHGKIRSTLLELGMGVDLHLARADVVERFVALLRTHAMREDRELYAWSEERLGLVERGTVLERLVARLEHMPAK